ncbi:MOCS2 [Bugula neritina]|uniref:Molybdopterin synthase catalytic subunit n=1 Tax=Bugula neritina TaxID=10212 RepID=A0A7J7J2L9_BUGNE|nr:MOCS2 [Bugula neritina]
MIFLTHNKISVATHIEAVVLPSCGAISTFIGTTRDNFNDKKVIRLEYECYNSMALKELEKICLQMRNKFEDLGRVCIVHRLGLVPVCEASVFIAVSSPHRAAAIAAAEFCINQVKATVPIWKKEIYEDATSEWKENKEFFRATS